MKITIEYLRGNLEPAEGHYDMDAVREEYERIAADLISQSYPDAEIVFRGQPASGGTGERIDSDGEIDEESIRADLARAFDEIDWAKCQDVVNVEYEVSCGEGYCTPDEGWDKFLELESERLTAILREKYPRAKISVNLTFGESIDYALYGEAADGESRLIFADPFSKLGW